MGIADRKTPKTMLIEYIVLHQSSSDHTGIIARRIKEKSAA